jgi:hypothetical protein
MQMRQKGAIAAVDTYAKRAVLPQAVMHTADLPQAASTHMVCMHFTGIWEGQANGKARHMGKPGI